MASDAEGEALVPRDTPRRRAWLNRSMMPVMAALTAALVGIAVLVVQTFEAEHDARSRVIRETQRLSSLQQVLQTVVDAETGQRGYLLTGRAAYLYPYRQATRRVGTELQGLQAMSDSVSDDTEIEHLRELDRSVQVKMAELARTVTLADTGRHDDAMKVVTSDVGHREMGVIRAEVAWLIAAETRRRDVAFGRVSAVEQRVLALSAVLGLAILALAVTGFRSERERSQVLAEAEQAAALREANDHAQLLARELNHRVKNLFSVILAIVSLSGRKSGSTRDVVEDIRARIRALSLAHTVSQGSVSNAAVRLDEIITRTMEPYRDADGTRVRISGPPQEISVRSVTPIGLIVHELATNAVKYGALSSDTGCVDIAWLLKPAPEANGTELHLCWIESGGPTLNVVNDDPPQSGYGSQMIVSAANQLGGRVEREWRERGLVLRIIFPQPRSS